MYSTLNKYGQSHTAVMTHYPCPLGTFQKPHGPSPKTPISQKNYSELPITVKHTGSLAGRESNNLLPVMDPAFNLREICKQCILLEDHLSHDDKRCTDCCTKHFLTLEALAEEAITLDKNGNLPDNAKQLPHKIRDLQIFWIENPDKCPEISQKLREIRKLYQQDSFDVIRNKCSGSSCSIR
jgi:hypothetical protein